MTRLPTVTAVMPLLGAVVLRVFDHDEYPTMGEAIWFTLQAVRSDGAESLGQLLGDHRIEELAGRDFGSGDEPLNASRAPR